MNKIILTLSLFIFLLPFSSPAQELKGEDIYAKINNAVVTVYALDANNNTLSQGSGVVLNNKGWVVTNYHVFAGADKLVVKHNEKIITYTNIVGLDVEKDILILKIKDNSFQSISIGNSDSLKVGQKIYAIGSPMGFENTMTDGIISGLRHYEKGTKDFIQISTPISHGSSGGAVVNAKGELIGISTLSATDGQNLNFAIPVNDILKVYKQEGVKQNEINAAFYLKKGNNELDKKKYDDAIADYKQAIAINPELGEVYNNLGITYDKKGEIETAITYYKKAIDINPEDDAPYNNLGIAYYNKGDIEIAINYYKKAITKNPELVEAYNNLGIAYGKKGDFKTAINYLKKAIAINPEYANAYVNLGIVDYNKGDIEAAINHYNKAITKNPELAEAYNNLGIIYGEKGEIETAINYFKKVIAINPEYTNAYLKLGALYVKKGDNENVIFYLKKAIAINPEDADACYLLGLTYGIKEDFETEIYYYKKVIAINPEYANAYYNLGVAYGKKGDERMKQYYKEKAYQLDPSLKK